MVVRGRQAPPLEVEAAEELMTELVGLVVVVEAAVVCEPSVDDG